MADLSSLIRLHKHELDEKQKKLGLLYDHLQALQERKETLERRRAAEIEAAAENLDAVSYTIAGFLEKSIAQEAEIDRQIFISQQEIDLAIDDMIEAFGEFKKYELTQAERERIEAEEQKLKENRMFDDIALQNYRQQQDEGQ